MNWYVVGFRRSLDFAGRTHRAGYWMFMLVNVLLFAAFHVLDHVTGLAHGPRGPFASLYALIVTLPAWAVTIRRLHDIGKSGWFALVALVPIVGGIVLVVWLAKKGDAQTNAYGAPPLPG